MTVVTFPIIASLWFSRPFFVSGYVEADVGAIFGCVVDDISGGDDDGDNNISSNHDDNNNIFLTTAMIIIIIMSIITPVLLLPFITHSSPVIHLQTQSIHSPKKVFNPPACSLPAKQ